MFRIIQFSLCFYTICTLEANSISNEKPNEPNISWYNSTNDISVASTLTQSPENVGGGQIKVFLKNNASAERDYSPNDFDNGIKIYYQNLEGKTISLHDYSKFQGVNIHRHTAAAIESGEFLCITIDLNAADFNFLKIFPCKYDFSVFDPTTWHFYRIETPLKAISQ